LSSHTNRLSAAALALVALCLEPASLQAQPVVEETEETEAPPAPATSPSRPAPGASRPAPAPPPPLPPRPPEPVEEEVVVSTTRTPRKLADAPSIVSLIGREELLRLGYRTLEEALRNTVGFEVNQNGHWPDTGVRGINDRTTYGDKIQFLVDGHDMSWRQFNRNFHNLSWVAIDEIARIELVRGPGSALWGANALCGVVNIVTRDWSNQNTAEIVLGADHRFASQQLSARAGISFGDLSFYTAVNYFASDNDALLTPLREPELLGKGTIRVEGDQHTGIGLNVKARWRWFRLSFQKSRFDANAPLSTFSVVGGDDSRFITEPVGQMNAIPGVRR
jgi:outer membrane receptor protein involved in Fe transport